MTNHCGSCTACCRVFDIAELKKPAGKWCDHCAIGSGCTIYDARPKACVEFECLWLLSQKRESPREHLPAALRPDKCKVVFAPSTNESVVAAITMPGAPGAWRRPDVRALIDVLVKNNDVAVVCGAAGSTRRTMITREIEKEVEMTPPDENGMQWNIDPMPNPPKEQKP